MSVKYSIVRQREVEYCFWLIFEEAGGVRLTRGEPDCHRSERAVAMSATLPRSLWSTPSLRATLTIDAPAAGAGVHIDVKAAAAALRTTLGVDVDISVHQAEESVG